MRVIGPLLALVMLASCSPADVGPRSLPSDTVGAPTTGATPTPPSLPASAARGRIVVDSDLGGILLVDLTDGSTRRLVAFGGEQFDADASGDQVVFRDSRHGVNVDDEIWVVGIDGHHARNLTRAPDSNEWGPAWSPDGSEIAFSSDRGGFPRVYVMNADGTGVRRLSDVEGEYPAWSPDGERIAFASNVGGTTPFGDPAYDIFVMDASGRNVRNVTSSPETYDMYPTWSPDGMWIAFGSTRGTPEDFAPPQYDLERRSDSDIWVMRPDGAELRDLTADLGRLDTFPDWSPSSTIVYDREGAIVLLDPETSAELDVTARTGVFGGFPAWVATV